MQVIRCWPFAGSTVRNLRPWRRASLRPPMHNFTHRCLPADLKWLCRDKYVHILLQPPFISFIVGIIDSVTLTLFFSMIPLPALSLWHTFFPCQSRARYVTGLSSTLATVLTIVHYHYHSDCTVMLHFCKGKGTKRPTPKRWTLLVVLHPGVCVRTAPF